MHWAYALIGINALRNHWFVRLRIRWRCKWHGLDSFKQRSIIFWVYCQLGKFSLETIELHFYQNMFFRSFNHNHFDGTCKWSKFSEKNKSYQHCANTRLLDNTQSIITNNSPLLLFSGVHGDLSVLVNQPCQPWQSSRCLLLPQRWREGQEERRSRAIEREKNIPHLTSATAGHPQAIKFRTPN